MRPRCQSERHRRSTTTLSIPTNRSRPPPLLRPRYPSSRDTRATRRDATTVASRARTRASSTLVATRNYLLIIFSFFFSPLHCSLLFFFLLFPFFSCFSFFFFSFFSLNTQPNDTYKPCTHYYAPVSSSYLITNTAYIYVYLYDRTKLVEIVFLSTNFMSND